MTPWHLTALVAIVALIVILTRFHIRLHKLKKEVREYHQLHFEKTNRR